MANGQNIVCAWWGRAATNTLNRQIFSAAVVVGVLALVVKIAAMAKEMMVAAWFGTGDDLDAYLIALILPSYVATVLSGTFNAALIPVHIHTRENEGADAAQRLFSSTVAFSSALLAISTIILAFIGPAIIPHLCSGFNPEKIALTQRLFYFFLPMVFVAGLLTNWEALLNAGERFGVAALAPAVVSLSAILALVVLARTCGIYALAIGTVAGLGLQIVILGLALKRREAQLLPRWHGLDPNLRKVIKQYLPMLAGSMLMGSTVIIDQAMAATLPSGSVAALNYGYKLVALATGVGTMALSTAVLPYFSKMVAHADWDGIRHTLRTYTRLIVLVSIPATAIAICLSTPIVRLLFQRGSFSDADTLLVSRVQAMFMLQLPFYTLGILYVRMISSLQANHILLWGTLISCVLNISLNYVLMQWFGVIGIALSTTLVYVASYAFLAAMLSRKLKMVMES